MGRWHEVGSPADLTCALSMDQAVNDSPVGKFHSGYFVRLTPVMS